MSADSKIEWTDATWNPVRGCRKISPGCKHCYAETFAERWRGVAGHAYEKGFDPRLAPDQLGAPLRWKKPRKVFVNSMSDLFLEDFPDEYIAAVFGVMAACPHHTFQVLTKRAERLPRWFDFAGWWPDQSGRIYTHAEVCRSEALGRIEHRRPDGSALPGPTQALFGYDTRWPLPNVWLGVSVEGPGYRERIDELRKVPAAVRFLSIEPLLEDVGELDLTGIGWVIVGGESGRKARPFDVAWARRIVEQCKAAGVPVFVKQLGARPTDGHLPIVLDVEHDGISGVCGGGAVPLGLSLRDPKGGDPSEWPADLRIREFPEVSR
jgi:protein gp37